MDTSSPSPQDTASGSASATDVVSPFGRREYDRAPPRQAPKTSKESFRKRRPVLFWLGICVVLGVALTAFGEWLGKDEDNIFGREYLAVVRVEGFIGDTRKLLAWIDRLTRDKGVKGVLLRVNSPGGGAAASHELYDALRRLAAAKPLYASMGSVAASGGLMTALAAERILASPSTLTGSIGVKMEIPQLQGLMEKLGLHRESIASGKYKDAGSPFRPMSTDERAYLSEIIDDMHKNFVTLVVQARKLPEEQVRAMADGRIVTGAKALELGLIDELGGQAEALRQLRAAAHVGFGTPILEQPREGKFLRELLESVLGIELDARAAVPELLHIY
jgi:protease-4